MDELVKNLRKMKNSGNCVIASTENFHAMQIIEQAANAIEELNKPRWIPVRERLPSAEKEVYVTDGEYIARAILLDEVFPGDKPCWSYSGLGEITHWCEQIPLPEPQKEE